jgi:creatinine amidohydrolase
MSVVHDWDRLTRVEIARLAPDALTVIPVGTTEQHGPHLATGTDALIASAVARLAAESASRPADILLAPTLAYGASHHHLPFGGTLSLDVLTFQHVLRDLLASAASAGCRRVFVVNAHGGNAPSCVTAVTEASREHGLVAATALIADLVAPGELEGPVRGHAGCFETSVMLELDGARVHLDRAAPSPGGPARTRSRGLFVAEPGRWRELDGFTDRPDEASQAQGRTALDACASALARCFEEVSDVAC